jgi:hypothetical protein
MRPYGPVFEILMVECVQAVMKVDIYFGVLLKYSRQYFLTVSEEQLMPASNVIGNDPAGLTMRRQAGLSPKIC